MAQFLNLLWFVIACIVLFTSSYWLLRSIRIIAQFLRISEFVAGFVILAIGTSIPELIVGINAALGGSPEISLGNIIGANILDLTLVIGIPVLLARGIKIESKTIHRDALYMFFIVALPIVLMILGNTLSRFDGVILILTFILYMRRIMKQKSEFHKAFHEEERIKRYKIALSFLMLFISLFILYLSSQYVIQFAELIAIDFMLPQLFIGIFVLSIGTTLPELVTSTRAAMMGEKGIAIGNIVGTVVANSALILGIVALINPIQANFLIFITSSFFMIVMAFLFLVFIDSNDEITWKEGMALIMFYVLFLIIELNLKGFIPNGV